MQSLWGLPWILASSVWGRFQVVLGARKVQGAKFGVLRGSSIDACREGEFSLSSRLHDFCVGACRCHGFFLISPRDHGDFQGTSFCNLRV